MPKLNVSRSIEINAPQSKVFDILSDFEYHSVNDVAIALGYGNPRSMTNTKVFVALEKAGLVVGQGKGGPYKFTDQIPRLES